MSTTHRVPRFIYTLQHKAKTPSSSPLIKIPKRSKSSSNHESHNNVQNSFDEMPHSDIYTLNSRLASYTRTKDHLSAWSLFHNIHRSSHILNSYTFTPILASCCTLFDVQRGRQVHALMIKTGCDSVMVTKTALMDMYSKLGHLGDSVSVFEEIGFKDVVVWNAMLSGFLRYGFPVKALNAFQGMRKEGIELSEFTLCSLLKACAASKAFLQGKQVHGLVIVMGRDLIVLGTALIDFYSGVGLVEEAVRVYRYLSTCEKDDVMRNSLISGCVLNKKYEEAFSIMSTMRHNVVALTSALSACSKNSDTWIGKQIHGVSIRSGFTFDTQLCNVLLDMYAKCGKILNARTLFDGMVKKDVISWTSMIDAYGNHGHGIEAVELFQKMGEEGSGVFPNSVTFLAVLSACSHSGMVKEGQECFILSQEKYKLVPGPEHYACFIDILGRASLIKEVWCLFHDMVEKGVKPTASVWAALLNACRHNLDIARGEFAAKQLLELEPNKPGNYVLLSNFYADIGRWDSVDELRNMMVKNCLDKNIARSVLHRVDKDYRKPDLSNKGC